uniref:Serine/threonine-protein phosphatase n=1 Tax=Rhabditophanes sp. KR3021 TaxID=114890 RepID=A0AC35U973_9BILA
MPATTTSPKDTTSKSKEKVSTSDSANSTKKEPTTSLCETKKVPTGGGKAASGKKKTDPTNDGKSEVFLKSKKKDKETAIGTLKNTSGPVVAAVPTTAVAPSKSKKDITSKKQDDPGTSQIKSILEPTSVFLPKPPTQKDDVCGEDKIATEASLSNPISGMENASDSIGNALECEAEIKIVVIRTWKDAQRERNGFIEGDKSTAHLDAVGEPCYDMAAFMRKHPINTRLGSVAYEIEEIEWILKQALDIFKKGPTLEEVSGNVTVCGDVHGQIDDVMRIFKKFGDPSKTKYMFLGDYVDRGNNSIEVIMLLLAYKIQYPKNLFLLRGNHELAHINKVYGYFDECCERITDQNVASDIYNKCNEVFSYLPLAGCISNKILCMHGGISEHINSLDDIRNIKRPLSIVQKAACDILWSDPDIKCGKFTFNSARGVSVVFGTNDVTQFCKKLGIDMVIRGHQVCAQGYSVFGDGKLITVFSASVYDEEINNLSGVIRIDERGIVRPYSIKCPKVERARRTLHEGSSDELTKEIATSTKSKSATK